jgi:site-specific recombinase XerD
VVALDLADFNSTSGTLLIRGKGNKERTGYVSNGARAALDAWLRHRGLADGPFFFPVQKGGTILSRRITDQAVFDLVVRLAGRAGVVAFSPHDLRRSWIGDLLEAGADVSTVQQLAGHSNVATTGRYDRRGERTKRKAVELLFVPFMG